MYELLQWFGVPAITVEKIKSGEGVANEIDINVDEDHPPDEALDVDIEMLKTFCSAKAWEKVYSACKHKFYFAYPRLK